jgi:hypothetical protein
MTSLAPTMLSGTFDPESRLAMLTFSDPASNRGVKVMLDPRGVRLLLRACRAAVRAGLDSGPAAEPEYQAPPPSPHPDFLRPPTPDPRRTP